jgi:type I restriction enzyme, S subunit
MFLEMFGDPITSKKKWNLLQVSEFAESRLGKMLDAKKIIGNNLKPYLRNSNVVWFGFKLNDLLEMDFDEKDRVEFSLRNGDILMCEGGEIGRCAIWRDGLEECYFQKAIHRIRLNKVIALPEYFVYMFWLYTMNGGLNKYMGASTISHLTGEKLKKMKLPIPPLALQTQFAQIVSTTEALKTQYQQSLQELENLYGSLSQKAFKGELSANQLAKM